MGATCTTCKFKGTNEQSIDCTEIDQEPKSLSYWKEPTHNYGAGAPNNKTDYLPCVSEKTIKKKARPTTSNNLVFLNNNVHSLDDTSSIHKNNQFTLTNNSHGPNDHPYLSNSSGAGNATSGKEQLHATLKNSRTSKVEKMTKVSSIPLVEKVENYLNQQIYPRAIEKIEEKAIQITQPIVEVTPTRSVSHSNTMVPPAISNPLNQTGLMLSMKDNERIHNSKVTDMSFVNNPTGYSTFKLNNDFVRVLKENVNDKYQFIRKLGEGSYGSVHKAVCIGSKQERAIKIIKKTKISKLQSSLFAELEILKTLDHPNIIKLYEVFDYKEFYYVVTEYCDGGELFEAVKKNQRFSEKDAAFIMRQLLSAMTYLHNRRIVHRDLKPENIVFSTNPEHNLVNSEIKIIDFGTAEIVKENKMLHARVGSPYYVAPEVLNQNYDIKCDIWSCGVIMYVLLSGYPPFRGRSHEEIFNNIQRGKLSFEGNIFNYSDKVWTKISKQAKELVRCMLDRNFTRRITAEAALNHVWTTRCESSEPIGNQALLNMENFFFKNKFVAVVETYLATNTISQAERKALADKFKEVDKDGSGVIDREELVDAYKSIYGIINEEVIAKIIATIDTNCSGMIDFTEFIVATYNHEKLFQRKALEEAFDFFDQDKTGFIEISELREILGDACDNDQVKNIMDELDANGDNQISKDEFVEKLLPQDNAM